MEAGFNPAIRPAGLVASPCARSAGFDAAVSNPRRRFAQSQATRKGLAGSTSRPVEFLFRSAMSDSEKTGREFRSRTLAHFFRGRGDESIHSCVPARFKLVTSRLTSAVNQSPLRPISARRW
jgi:hypothetical protein